MSDLPENHPCENAVTFRAVQLLLFRSAGEDGLPRAECGHHLSFERHKGWVLRVTIERGRKVIGKRKKFYLKTRERSEAEKRRELVLGTLKCLGLTVRMRMQKNRKSAE